MGSDVPNEKVGVTGAGLGAVGAWDLNVLKGEGEGNDQGLTLGVKEGPIGPGCQGEKGVKEGGGGGTAEGPESLGRAQSSTGCVESC